MSRLIAECSLPLLPATFAFVLLASRGVIAPIWAAMVIGASLICALAAILILHRAATNRANRLAILAEVLTRRELPSAAPPREHYLDASAEQQLLHAITEIVREVRTLAERSAEFETILRGMTEAVVVTGPRREVLLLNRAAHRLFALPAELDYRGRDFIELCRDPRVQDLVERAGAPEFAEALAVELQMQIPAPRALEISAAPLPRNPSSAARVFVFHDITRLKSSELARADFIANLTHELRTPLTALYGYAETLQNGVGDAATEKRFLGIIERQSRRLARLLDDLVSLSELERGLTPLRIEKLEATQLAQEAVELMGEAARKRGVGLKLTSLDRTIELEGDRDRLLQVLINLLDNAIKYTPREGRVTVEVRPSNSGMEGHDGRGEVEFVVSDTGEGIPAAHIPRLTERFYRVDRARSRELGGTGLGLAIVKHILQLHGGTMRIASRIREGTTVTVQLPQAGSSDSHA